MDELKVLREFFSSPEPPSPVVIQRHKEMLMNHIESSAEEPTSTAMASRVAKTDRAVSNDRGGPVDRESGKRESRSRKAAVVVALPVLAVALAAAGWAVLRTDASEAVSFSCVTDGVVSVMPNYGASPIDQCADMWASGGMIPGVTEAPPLAACVDRNGAVMVIEGNGESACVSDGMAPWTDQPKYEKAGEAVRQVLITFHDRLKATGNACATVDDWRGGLASQPGTTGWHIAVNQIESSRHCYEVGLIDPTSQRITLIGSPGDSSIGCDPRTGC